MKTITVKHFTLKPASLIRVNNSICNLTRAYKPLSSNFLRFLFSSLVSLTGERNMFYRPKLMYVHCRFVAWQHCNS
jgi:hypothetical protein